MYPHNNIVALGVFRDIELYRGPRPLTSVSAWNHEAVRHEERPRDKLSLHVATGVKTLICLCSSVRRQSAEGILCLHRLPESVLLHGASYDVSCGGVIIAVMAFYESHVVSLRD